MVRESMIVFTDYDLLSAKAKNLLPNMATHKDQESCGYSVYKDVLVQWDEDDDDRILDVIDCMEPSVRKNLLICQEHEGSVAFVWKNEVPEGYTEEDDIDTPDGDVWCICSSKVA